MPKIPELEYAQEDGLTDEWMDGKPSYLIGVTLGILACDYKYGDEEVSLLQWAERQGISYPVKGMFGSF